MDKGIDASLGLEAVLMTLQRLRKHGVLQAEVSHIPGIRGRCHCAIEIVGGKITSCIVEDPAGHRSSIGLDVIVATNQKKGPFAWSFHPKAPPQQAPRSLPGIDQASPARSLPGIDQASPATYNPYQQQQSPGVPQQYSYAISGNTIPVPLKRASDLYWPQSLSANEKVMLGWIFSLVDGQRTVADITIMLPRLRLEDVRNGLLFLKRMGTIELMG